MNPLDTLEHARKHAKAIAPLLWRYPRMTLDDMIAYQRTQETFSKAFWDVMRECEFFKHEDHSA
jgi:hypothetical protein